jgi:putative membrane protein
MAPVPPQNRPRRQDDLADAADAVEGTAESVEDSAEAIEETSVKQTEAADRRTELAANRTVLAAERTYAAWVRTGLAALAAGVGAQALLEDVIPAWLTRPTGSALILFSAFCFLAAIWRELWPGAPPPEPDTRQMPAALLIAINGFLVFVSLAALVGVWIRPQ